MRGKLTDQDLTNYALNEGLEARERLYVESLLGVNEECRGDVYKMLELGQLLERGFEMESNRTVPRLTRSQREKLLTAKPQLQVYPFVRRTAAALSLAACVAFVVANPAGWLQGHARSMATVTNEVSRMVSDAITEGEDDDYAQWVSLPTESADDSAYIQTSSDGMPAGEMSDAICTPPSSATPVVEASEGQE